MAFLDELLQHSEERYSGVAQVLPLASSLNVSLRGWLESELFQSPLMDSQRTISD